MTEQASLVGALRSGPREPDELEMGLNALIERRAANAEHREARRHLWITYYRRFALNHAGLATADDMEDFRTIVEERGRPRVPADMTSEAVRGPDAA